MSMKAKSKMWVCRFGFLLSIISLLFLGGCASTPKKATSSTKPPSQKQGEATPSRAYFRESPSLTGEDFAASAASLAKSAQALSQDTEKLRAKAKEPIQIASLPEKGASPLPTTAPTSKMLEMASSLSTQAQALSQDTEKLRAKAKEPIQIASLPERGSLPLPTTAPTSKMLEMASSLSTQAQALSQDTEKLRAKTAVPLPELTPLPSTNLGPKLVEVPVALVPEKEVQYLPSLKAVGKKKEEKSPLDDIFFDFDQYLLTEGAQNILQKNAEWLRSHPQARILIEGHCDERGTVEYNLALGERRAQSVKDYLSNLGISSDRISMISYGKEKPFVVGYSEESWAQNRRAHFLLQSP